MPADEDLAGDNQAFLALCMRVRVERSSREHADERGHVVRRRVVTQELDRHALRERPPFAFTRADGVCAAGALAEARHHALPQANPHLRPELQGIDRFGHAIEYPEPGVAETSTRLNPGHVVGYRSHA